MTEAETKMLDEVRENVKELRGEVSMLSASVAAHNATMLATNDRHATEIAVLFGTRRDHETRISSIERDYVKLEKHEALEKRINELEKSQARLLGMVSLIQVIGLGGIAALIKWGGAS